MGPNYRSNLSHFIMFHKPKGAIVTLSDEKSRKTVYDILPGFVFDDGWMPVGRLDKGSRGMLLFTRDGGLINHLTKPGYCKKIYEVWIRGRITKEQLGQTLRGVKTTIGLLRLERVEISGYAGPKVRLLVELLEGKNRHIRRIFGALHDTQYQTPLKVLDLKRIQIGTVRLDIPSSRWRFLTNNEGKSLIQGITISSLKS